MEIALVAMIIVGGVFGVCHIGLTRDIEIQLRRIATALEEKATDE